MIWTPYDWLNKLLSLVGMVLELKHVVETNLIRVTYHCISCYFHFNIPFKQLYTSYKTECFNYKGGYGVHGLMHIEAFKEELAWVIDKRLQVISNKMLFKTVIPLLLVLGEEWLVSPHYG